MTTVILTAYDKSSMIEERNLREAVEVLQDVKSRIRVPLVDEVSFAAANHIGEELLSKLIET